MAPDTPVHGNGIRRLGALVIFGSGPGIGAHVATRFAREGFRRIILLSRNGRRLSDDAFLVRSQVPQTRVDIVQVDLANEAWRATAFAEIEALLDGVAIECILFNAAKVTPSELLEFPLQDFRQALEVSVVSLYAVAQWGIPQLLRLVDDHEYMPVLLVTSGLMAHDPLPQMFSLAACKAAQRSLVTSLHKTFHPQGVQCALIVVGSEVSEQAVRCNPTNIAEETWKLYCRDAQDDSPLEIEIREPGSGGANRR